MDVIEIDRDRAVQLLTEAVELRGPNTVIDACRYALRAAPHCIVGQALALAGVPVEKLAEMDRLVSGSPQIDAPDHFGEELDHSEFGFKLTAEALRVFGEAQRIQDRSYPWDQALDAALATAEDLAKGGVAA